MKYGNQNNWGPASLYAPLALMFVLALMTVASLRAQTSTTGDIAGVVTDPTAAVVPGVSVSLKNLETGSSASTTTTSQGSYNFAFLQPGNYSITASVAGFQKIVENVTVALG